MPEPKRAYTTNVGDLLVIFITGMLGQHIAEITKSDPLEMKVEESGFFSRLKSGDFIVLETATEQLQGDCREDTNLFLETEQKAGRKVYSGLAKLGVTDGKLHEILPG